MIGHDHEGIEMHPVANFFRSLPFPDDNLSQGVQLHPPLLHHAEETPAILRTHGYKVRGGLGVIPLIGAARRVVCSVFLVSRRHGVMESEPEGRVVTLGLSFDGPKPAAGELPHPHVPGKP